MRILVGLWSYTQVKEKWGFFFKTCILKVPVNICYYIYLLQQVLCINFAQSFLYLFSSRLLSLLNQSPNLFYFKCLLTIITFYYPTSVCPLLNSPNSGVFWLITDPITPVSPLMLYILFLSVLLYFLSADSFNNEDIRIANSCYDISFYLYILFIFNSVER